MVIIVVIIVVIVVPIVVIVVPIVTNLNLDKVIMMHLVKKKVQVCRVDLNLTESICSDLNNHEAEGNKVQAQVNILCQNVSGVYKTFLVQVTKLELYKTLITAFPCILVSTLLATWLEHHPLHPDHPDHYIYNHSSSSISQPP